VEWEAVTDDTDRLPVPGGWLYRVFSKFDRGSSASARVNIIFVPHSKEELRDDMWDAMGRP
jgi:hypothetical protein